MLAALFQLAIIPLFESLTVNSSQRFRRVGDLEKSEICDSEDIMSN